jgi:hypothetical protein
MGDASDVNQPSGVIDGVHDAVVSHANAPAVLMAAQLFADCRARIISEIP